MPWTNEHALITARQSLAAATCDAPSPGSGYRIYALGGADSTNTPLNTAEVYDTSLNTWSPLTATMSTARVNLAATSGPGRLYALGGFDGTNPLDSVEIFNPAANTLGAECSNAHSEGRTGCRYGPRREYLRHRWSERPAGNTQFSHHRGGI